ncbi:MAG TPA: nicotinate (nicotinamide) nucleotide adenylyltransferase [Solirubrobacteraceae bacterium]|nr:nicotinate (nicotinamide) nucleotide adenylyltransferase [Solirubrobacteraceae bacterium]
MLEPRAGREALRSLGILGGTFNPPHVGHLAIAEHALRELSLSRVVLMPARWPPHKPVEHEPGAERRLEMCRLLLAGVERVGVCALELERDGPSYTVDTLDVIHASHPETELTLIVGADIAATIPAWHEPQRLFERADVAVAARRGADCRSVNAALAPLASSQSRVRFLDSPLVEVSSSLVRERAAADEPLEELVGPGVAGYIAEHGLYGALAREASR